MADILNEGSSPEPTLEATFAYLEPTSKSTPELALEQAFCILISKSRFQS